MPTLIGTVKVTGISTYGISTVPRTGSATLSDQFHLSLNDPSIVASAVTSVLPVTDTRCRTTVGTHQWNCTSYFTVPVTPPRSRTEKSPLPENVSWVAKWYG